MITIVSLPFYQHNLSFLKNLLWLLNLIKNLFNFHSEMADAYFELVSMLCELALWYMKHSSKIASGDR